MKPTATTYSELQQAFDAFNKGLFDGLLPECLITLQREKISMGYFSPGRFVNESGDKVDEIALNPTYFAVVPLVEIMQLIAHEMVHAWQHHNAKPGRGRYHNTEWADKMESIGLMPSSTGKPGGKRTGDRMADYPIDGGRFLEVCKDLITDHFKISWYDRFVSKVVKNDGEENVLSTLELADGLLSIANDELDLKGNSDNKSKSNRAKYTCMCAINVWGKPKLNLICGECGCNFVELLKDEKLVDNPASPDGDRPLLPTE